MEGLKVASETLLSEYGGLTANSLNIHLCRNESTADIDHLINNHIHESYYYSLDEFINFQITRKNEFRILSFNARSIRPRHDELNLILDNCAEQGAEIAAVLIQESWLTNDALINTLGIKGYTMINKFARINRCGGLTIYLNDKFTYEEILEPVISNVFESQFIKIQISCVVPLSLSLYIYIYIFIIYINTVCYLFSFIYGSRT